MKQETLAAKQAVIKSIEKDFKEATSVAIVEYRGLSVNELETLRRSLRKEDAVMKVYKNTLVDRVLEELGFAELRKDLEGPNALVFSHKDSVAGPRNAVKFAKTHEKTVIKGGIFEGKVITSDELKVIATLPSREGLLSMLLGCLQAPVRNFAYAVKSIGEKKEKEAPAAPAAAAPAAAAPAAPAAA